MSADLETPRRIGGGPLKRLFVGRAIASDKAEHQLLPKFLALPVFSSDPLSSNAYATEEMMLVLVAAGAGALALRLPIALAIAALLLIVVTSYRQTVRAYPRGGGSYIVARENLGTLPGLVAAAAILTDYVLTVAVSITAGTTADHVGGARGPGAAPRADRRRPRRARHAGEPPRGQGGRGAVRDPDLRLRAHDRDHARGGLRPVPRGMSGRGDRRPSRSRSSTPCRSS